MSIINSILEEYLSDSSIFFINFFIIHLLDIVKTIESSTREHDLTNTLTRKDMQINIDFISKKDNYIEEVDGMPLNIAITYYTLYWFLELYKKGNNIVIIHVF